MSLKAASARLPALTSLLLAVLAFLQSPGRITFDTKLDLAVNPGGFLERALHLWDPQGGFGQLQNQAFGYFFPLGPFFWLGHALQVPPWVVQRAWSALLLVVAFEGARRLAQSVLGVSAWVGLVGGLAYALGPRMISTDGAISAEALVVALVPWTVLPLVVVEHWGVRRAAALSALAVLLMGGANATLVLMVLPVPALWIVLGRGPRLRLLAWWSGGTLLAILWWLLPLLLLGRYSPPFLGWVESASNTTGPVGLSAAFRGVTDWVAYVSSGGQAYWPGAGRLVTSSLLVAATGGVAVLGVVGLATKGLPHRRPLRAMAAVGLLMMVLGFTGKVQSPFAGDVRSLLDGVLAPLRNVSKADPVLRLPLVLGFTFAVSRLAALRQHGRRFQLGSLAPLFAAVLVLVAALPLLQGQSRPGPAFEKIPSWWTQAAEATARTPGRTLVLPGAGAGRQEWGRTIDEPLQPLARGRWGVRDQVPLGGAGSTRLLDGVEAVLAGGVGSDRLADLLGRSGIGRLLVRNDLASGADAVSPTLVHAALEGSPGLTRVATFGPSTVARGELTNGRPQEYPEVELWSVDRPIVQEVRVAPLAGVPLVSGGPESVLQLLEAGLLDPATPTVLAGQASAVGDQLTAFVTDGLRRRERSFGRIHKALGPVLTPTARFVQPRPVHDLLPFDATGHQTVVRYAGISDVTASSTAADVTQPGGPDLAVLPYAAVDGNAYTGWRSAPSFAVKGQWLQVSLPASKDLPSLSVSVEQDRLRGPTVTRVAVTTDSGRSEHDLKATTAPQTLELPAGTSTKRVRITIIGTGGANVGQVGIAELALPGVLPERTLVAPEDTPSTAVTGYSFAMSPEVRGSCVRDASATDCDAELAATSDEETVLDRTFAVPSTTTFHVAGSVVARPGASAAGLLEPLRGLPIVLASSSFGGSAAVGGRAAFDGDPRTTWLAQPGDDAPALGLLLPTKQRLTSITLESPSRPRAAVPLRVRLRSPQGSRVVELDDDGHATFPALITNTVQISFPDVRPHPRSLSVGVAELKLNGVAPFALPGTAPTGALCGFGPALLIDGRNVPTRVVGTVSQVIEGRRLGLEVCGPAPSLGAGSHRVQVLASATFRPSTLALNPTAAPATTPLARAVTVTRWQSTSREVQVGAGAAGLLVVPENENTGWVARLAGRELTRTVVDGWQQAWLLPAGEGGPVTLSFTPDRTYRVGLLAGAFAALVLLALCLGRRRAQPVVAREPAARSRGWFGAVAAVALGGVLGGAVGAVIAVVVVVVVWRLVQPWLAAGALGAALTGVVVQGATDQDVLGPAGGWLSQVLGIALVCAVAAAPLAWTRDE